MQTVIDSIDSKTKIKKNAKSGKEAKVKSPIVHSTDVAKAMWGALGAKAVYIQFTADLLLNRNSKVSHNVARCMHYLRI